jgi:DNA relaxase NicK
VEKIIRLTPFQRQQSQKIREQKMTESIYPVRPGYVDSFDSSYAPLYPGSPLVGSFPPYTNRGGIKNKSTISTCYDLTPPSQKFSCIVDYLSVTFRMGDYQGNNLQIDKIEKLLESLRQFIPNLKSYPNKYGLFGYRQSLGLTRGDAGAGLIGFDGNNDSCYISFSGQGCVGVDMWALRRFYESLPGCKITRIDLAHDDLEGSLSVHDYKKLFDCGAFASKGTSPKGRFMDDMGSGDGCTLYVGKKVNGKEACIYEKGKQLGDKTSPWLRIEGRLTAVDRVIPFEAMTQPADFLAALYPPFAFLSVNHKFVEIVVKGASIALELMLDYASVAYGKLFDFLINMGWSCDKIVARMRRPGVPGRLCVSESQFKNMCPF